MRETLERVQDAFKKQPRRCHPARPQPKPKPKRRPSKEANDEKPNVFETGFEGECVAFEHLSACLPSFGEANWDQLGVQQQKQGDPTVMCEALRGSVQLDGAKAPIAAQRYNDSKRHVVYVYVCLP